MGRSTINSDVSFGNLLVGLETNKEKLKYENGQTFELFLNDKCRKGLDNIILQERKALQENVTTNMHSYYNKDLAKIIQR